MKNNPLKLRLFLAITSSLCTLSLQAAEQLDIGEITVTGTREDSLKSETPATVDKVDEKAIDFVRPAHPSELLGRIPGVQIAATSGEGHQTAIRQPLTTSAVYLYLEDGIPTRSTGFFNHNALYEVNLPQAAAVEVTKGPGSALYGSDAIGGVINVLTRPAPQQAEADLNVELGEFGWRRLLGSAGNTWGNDGVRTDLNLTHTDGWRDGTEYDRQSATVRWDRMSENGGALTVLMSGSNIDQQTAGTSRLSEADYEDHPTKNYYPISYRDVQAYRLSAAYEKEVGQTLWSVTPYVRSNSMEYMPNWSFSYDPNITKTGHDSLGMQLKFRRDFDPARTRLVVGADVDYSPGFHEEHSIDATKNADGIFTSYSVDELIYDYDVTYTGISPYLHLESSLTDKLRLNAGLRYDSMSYDYNNKIADGPMAVTFNTGTTKTVTYNHPGDTTVDFSHVSPKLGATYAFTPTFNAFVSYRHAFRAPSEGDLFRPGKSDASLDLEPVKVDSYETGLRGRSGETDYEVSLYYMRKKDDLVTFKDTITLEQYTTNAGETLHRGVELRVGTEITPTWRIDASYSHSKHTYEEWVVETSTDYSGNEMPAAPEDISNLRLGYAPGLFNGGKVELEWEHLGRYWLDNENTHRYGGHDLLNLRANYLVSKDLEFYARVMNIADKRYATAGSYTAATAWGPEKIEFAPGMPRAFYAGVSAKF